MAFIALLLILVPAPKIEPPREQSFAGAWFIEWGACRQETCFADDGSCYSPQFGAGTWANLEDGGIWFSERDGTAHYVMSFNRDGNGWGWCVTDGRHGEPVDVRIRRGELLPMPREVR